MKGIAERRNGIQYFDVAQGYAHIELGKCILEYLQDVEIEQYTPIILCIGTDRATGDCLGPLVGEQLLNYSETFHVMGCLSAPVHALNIHDALHDIRTIMKIHLLSQSMLRLEAAPTSDLSRSTTVLSCPEKV